MFGKSIKSLLAASSTLTTLVGTKIYPYILNENTTLPAVVYTIDGIEPEYNKKEWASDDIEFSVHSFSKDYSNLQSVVDAVRDALELKSAGYGSQDLNRIYVTGMEEGYELEGDFFFNKLTFRVKINTY